MKRSMCALAAVLTAAFAASLLSGLAAASPSHTSRLNQDYPPRPGGTAVFVIGLPNTNPNTQPNPKPVGKTTTLNAAQKSRVQSIALRDTRVRMLLHGKSYHVLATVPWVSHSTLAGGITTLGFSRSVTLSGTWLTQGHAYRATYKGVTRMTIYVNVGQSKVVTIQPH